MKDYMIITPAEKNRAEFRLRVVKLKTERPELSIMQMANIFNCSYSKIQPILKASGLNKLGHKRSKGPYKLTPQIRKKITNLYTENPDITMTKLSRQVSISAVSVSKVLEEAGLRRRQQLFVPTEAHLKMMQLKHEDPTRTLQSIADEVGCSRERVRQVFNKHGLNEQYPVDDMRAKRHKTFRNCLKCNRSLSSRSYVRKRGTCINCRNQELYEKKNTEYICDYCKKPFILSVYEYNHRLRGKQQYADKIQSTAPLTGVTCSYSCATQQRGFGTHVRGAKSKTNV